MLKRIDDRRATTLVNWASVIVPLALAWGFGLATGRSGGFFFGVTILSLGTIVFGINDLVFEIADSIEREQKRRKVAAQEAAVIVQHRAEFLRRVGTLGFDELWLVCMALHQRQRGIAKTFGDPVAEALVEAGWISRAQGFTAFGFPYYFTEEAWVVLNDLGAKVFEERNLLARQKGIAVESLPAFVPPPAYKTLEERLLELPGRLVVTLFSGLAGFFGFVAAGSVASAVLWLMLGAAAAVIIGLGLAIDEIVGWIGGLLG
ncbi:MAG: hypothetical protein FJX65_18985 [Alphaproteobacteria bacterium]|nr:hypothetical protein [Alphaproteobacteria bacterium]